MQIVGKPITVTGEFELLPHGKGRVYRIRHKAEVDVPLIGGVVGKFVLAQVEQGCADERGHLAEYVAHAGLHWRRRSGRGARETN
jgi:hypothetical protein